MKLLLLMLICLTLTEAVELPVLYLLGFRRRDLIIAALANVVTNPPVVLIRFVLLSLTSLPEWSVVLPLEISAVLVEALIYRRAAGRKRALPESFIANALSYSLGLVISILI